MHAPNMKNFEDALRARVKGEVSFDEATRGIYSTDASIYRMTPVAVVAPLDDEDVKMAVKTAAEHHVAILPRGGGTSLCGQTVGACMVMDFTRHMNKILEVNVEERWARVQPGVIRDGLNAFVAKDRLHFAPDPATADRASFGGMIANNSAGARSIIYGKVVDHVKELKVLLADGEVLELKPLAPEQYAERKASGGREGEIYSRVSDVIEANREEIEQRYPKIMRRVMGYNLEEFTKTDHWNLAKLVVGSEGSLATILEAKVNLEPLPNATALCIPHFASLEEAISAVEEILPHKPTQVEIMDGTVIRMARQQISIAKLCDFIEGDPEAILMIEFYGDTQAEADAKAAKLAEDLKSRGVGYAHPLRSDAAGKGRVLAVRKNGLGLMLGIKGERKPIPFIEDAAVPTVYLSEYVGKILDFCKSLDVPVALYAHVSVGLIHIRPVLDLKMKQDIEFMKQISQHAFDLVKGYGGCFSGEHGDGIVRGHYIRPFYGEQIYSAFKEVKNAFDPQNLMNPNKIVDAGPMDEHLRYGPNYKVNAFPTLYHYREDGSFAAAVELCTGVGACRNTLSGLMCPTYDATLDEKLSTRARANALRLAMTGEFGPEGMTSREVFEVLDLCLSCKGCKSECPSNVDLARLKSEFLQKYHDHHGLSLRDRMIATSADMAPILSGWMAPIANWVQGTSLFKGLLEAWVGFDRTRALPQYTSKPFHKWFEKRQAPKPPNGKRVVLFDDTYLNFYEPGIGKSAVELLEGCGYSVTLARAGCCQRPKISHGLLREAKREGERTLRALDGYIRQGLKIVVCEPSCASALTDDLPGLIEDVELGKRIRENVMMIDVFLDQQVKEGKIDCQFSSPFTKILLHGHCHQKSLYGTASMKSLWGKVEGLKVSEADSGCCGMAGSFGYEKEHKDLSLKVAETRLLPAIRNREEGAEVVACGFSCRHQIADTAGLKARHWVETIQVKKKGS